MTIPIGAYVRLVDGLRGWVTRAWRGPNGDVVFDLRMDGAAQPDLAGNDFVCNPGEVEEVLRHDPHVELEAWETWGDRCDERLVP